MKPGDTVLDAGCGAGEKAKYLMNQGLKVTGIDFSEQMIALARQDVPTGTFSVMDLYNLNGLTEQFDGVLSQASLLHIPKKDISAILQNLLDRLKPHGYLYIAVKEQRPGTSEERVETEHDYGYQYSRFFSYYTLEEMTNYLTDLGMKIVSSDVVDSGKTNWIQIISRKG